MKHLIGSLALLAVSTSPAQAQLWREFAHDGSPHVEWTNPDIPMAFDELFADPNAVKTVPVLVVLLEFNDLVHQPQHTPAFVADMVFGTGAGPWSSVRPSVAQTIAADTNGRLLVVPAAETSGAVNDGVIDWVTAQCPPGVSGSCGSSWYTNACGSNCIEKKRAEGVRRADPWINYSAYDSQAPGVPGHGVVTSDELTVIVMNAEDLCCDTHTEVGHGGPPGCSPCPGGNARRTDPGQVPVDGVDVHQLMTGVTEGAHPNVVAHEIGHQTLGHGDLYAVGGNPWSVQTDGRILYCYASSGCTHNDATGAAVPMSDGDIWRGSTTNAGGTGASSCAFQDTKDVWFRYTPLVSEPVTFTTCFPGTNFDTTLAVYELATGIEVDCNDDDFSCSATTRSTLTVPLQVGTTYLLRLSGWNGASGNYNLSVQGGQGQAVHPPERWFPEPPDRYSLMSYLGNYDSRYVFQLDPWAKLHLGFLKPRVVTHDGVYTVSSAELQATFPQQTANPQALVIYDPLRTPLYQEYFLIENRTLAPVTGGSLPDDDSGLALWVIDEVPYPGMPLALRQAVRLLRRGGPYSGDANALWAGPGAEGYDVTATSVPTDSAWNDGTPSHVELRDISAAGPNMSVFVRMTPIFVDGNNVGGPWVGTAGAPWRSVSDAAAAVANQDLDLDGVQDGRRTLRIQAGDYAENPLITAPTLLTSEGGTVVIRAP